MSIQDQNLIRKLVIAILIKLLVLFGLWWEFIRDQQVAVDGISASSHVLGTLKTKDKE